MFIFHSIMDIEEILAASAATDAFKSDVRRYITGGTAPRVKAPRYAPTVKVTRVIMQLLDSEPGLAVERVRIDAASGCCDFVGIIDVNCDDSTHRFQFAWDCRWRAEQQGWHDAFGFPDQIRAAQEFGWRCFRAWQSLKPAGVPAAEEGVGAL